MKTYLTYKNQLEGLDDVYSTVKTVEKVAASSIHLLKTEVQILQLNIAALGDILVRLSCFYEVNRHSFLETRSGSKKMLVVLTGEKGLVGGLWHSLVSAVLDKIASYQTLVVIGSKGARFLAEEDIKITQSFTISAGVLRQENVEKISSFVIDAFIKRLITQVDIIYPQFVSLVKQKPSLTGYLPFDFALEIGRDFPDKDLDKELGLPIFEPSKSDIFDSLLKKYIDMSFYKLMLETRLSELAARAVAMEYAAVKTQDLKERLKLVYFKGRRRFMTQKQLESFTVHKIM